MRERIQNDLKDAVRLKDGLRISVLRMLLASIHNRELEKRAKIGKAEDLTEEEVFAVIRSEVKKRRDAIEEFLKGGREDLVSREKQELKILESYLPSEPADHEIEKVIKEVVGGLGGVSSRDFGKVMAGVMQKLKGRVGGERVSALVRKFLSV